LTGGDTAAGTRRDRSAEARATGPLRSTAATRQRWIGIKGKVYLKDTADRRRLSKHEWRRTEAGKR